MLVMPFADFGYAILDEPSMFSGVFKRLTVVRIELQSVKFQSVGLSHPLECECVDVQDLSDSQLISVRNPRVRPKSYEPTEHSGRVGHRGCNPDQRAT